MSDFTSNFWAMYVAGITLFSIILCLVLLIVAGKAHAMTDSDNTTGHVWDGDLREYNNPLPRWWTYLFVLTVLFALGYLVLYPGLGSSPGRLGWSSHDQMVKEIAKGNEQTAPIYAKYLAMPVPEVAKDPVAMGMGERLFGNNCAQCHASDAHGSKGYPNLSDKDWLWGGAPENIKETIINGRMGNMPTMAAAVGGADDVKNVANYVLSLSKSPHDSVRAALGKEKFAACAACHGPDGKGMAAVGSANLTDDVWLHGYGEAAVIKIINAGKQNQMPAWKDKLTEGQIHILTAYIWGLSNR
jgi:cytochrome c oxidase cbb3-type subunit 3